MKLPQAASFQPSLPEASLALGAVAAAGRSSAVVAKSNISFAQLIAAFEARAGSPASSGRSAKAPAAQAGGMPSSFEAPVAVQAAASKAPVAPGDATCQPKNALANLLAAGRNAAVGSHPSSTLAALTASKGATANGAAKAAGTVSETDSAEAIPQNVSTKEVPTQVRKSDAAPVATAPAAGVPVARSQPLLTAAIPTSGAPERKRAAIAGPVSKQGDKAVPPQASADAAADLSGAKHSDAADKPAPSLDRKLARSSASQSPAAPPAPAVVLPQLEIPIASSGKPSPAAESAHSMSDTAQAAKGTKSSNTSVAVVNGSGSRRPKAEPTSAVTQKSADPFARLPFPLPLAAAPPQFIAPVGRAQLHENEFVAGTCLPTGRDGSPALQFFDPASKSGVPKAESQVPAPGTGLKSAAAEPAPAPSAGFAAALSSDAAAAQPEHLAFALAASAGQDPSSVSQLSSVSITAPSQPSSPGEPAKNDVGPAVAPFIPIAPGLQPGFAAIPGPQNRPVPDVQTPLSLPETHETAKLAAPDALRTLRVQFLGDNNQRVDVRLGDTGGQLRVSVRSTDPVLTQTLQDHMPELTARLGEQHFHTEVWLPPLAASFGAANSGTANASVGSARPVSSFFASSHPGGQGQPGGRQQGGQNQYRPAWIDDFGPAPRRTQSARRS